MKKSLKKTNSLGIAILILLFAQTTIANAQKSGGEEKIYVKIEVNGMACSYCAFGMEKALKKVSGVNNVAIELEDGMAYISTPKNQKPQKEKLSLIIQNAGFTPGSIRYSDSPFRKEASKE